METLNMLQQSANAQYTCPIRIIIKTAVCKQDGKTNKKMSQFPELKQKYECPCKPSQCIQVLLIF